MTINCYGDTGPWRRRPGWEQLAQSVTGIAMAEGASLDPAGRPRLVPAAAADYTTGYLAALGTMAALRRRSIEGGAYHVRASLCQTATWIAEDGPCVDPSTATGPGDITPVAGRGADPVRDAHPPDAGGPAVSDAGTVGDARRAARHPPADLATAMTRRQR